MLVGPLCLSLDEEIQPRTYFDTRLCKTVDSAIQRKNDQSHFQQSYFRYLNFPFKRARTSLIGFKLQR